MKIIQRVLARFSRKDHVPALTWANWSGSRTGETWGGQWQANVRPDCTDDLLQNSPIYACTSLVSRDIAKLQPRLMSRDAGIWTEVAWNAKISPLLRYPNRYQTASQFFNAWMLAKLIYGNTYVLKDFSPRGDVEAMYVLNSGSVIPMIAPDGEVYYQIGGNKLAGVDKGAVVHSSAIIHDRHNCLFHPLIGVSPLYAAAISGTQSNRIQANSSHFFGNMSRPSGQLTAPAKIDEVTANRLKESFEQGFSGSNVGRLLVAGDGLKFEPFTMPAEQAQLIEQLKWTGEDVARAFLVPAYKIGAGPMPSFPNVGALNLEYFQQALQPHVEDIEQLLDRGLGLDSTQRIEFDVDGLLRMDPKTRAETRQIEVQSAMLTPNEGRRAENRPPVDGGDAVFLQEQNFSLAALAKRDALPNPWSVRTGTAPSEGKSLPASRDDVVAAPGQ